MAQIKWEDKNYRVEHTKGHPCKMCCFQKASPECPKHPTQGNNTCDYFNETTQSGGNYYAYFALEDSE